MKKISYLLLLQPVIFMILCSSCHKRNDGKENEQISSRKISFTTLGSNFTNQLNEKLYKEVMDGKIKAYRYDSISPTCMFTAKEISSLSTFEESIEYRPDSTRPDLKLDTVLKEVFKPADIVGYSIAEKWKLDQKENEIEGEILAFAINWQPKIAGFQIPECPLFWVDYKDVVKLLGKDESEELKKAIYNSLITKLSE